MEKVRSKIKIEKAEQNWRRLQELREKESILKKVPHFEQRGDVIEKSHNESFLEKIA